LIILLIFMELLRQGYKFNSFSPREYYFPNTNITDFLIKNIGYKRVLGTIPAGMTIPYRLYSPDVYEPMLFTRYSQFISIINGGKPTIGTKFGIAENYKSPLIDLLGVKYIIYNPEDFRTNFYPVNPDFPKERFIKVYEYGKTQIYENLNVFPRAFFVNNIDIENDDIKISEKILSLDLSKTIILEDQPFLKTSKDQGKAEIISYKPNSVKIKTSTNKDSILFLSDNYYPGWVAFIDNKETKIYRANYTFRAVSVPAGEHLVNFEYRPDSYRIGMGLSLISLVVLISSLIILRKK